MKTLFLAFVALFSLVIAALAVVAAAAAQSWLVLAGCLGVAWLAFSLGLYGAAPGRPRRFGDPC